jgi:hypothetical protein
VTRDVGGVYFQVSNSTDSNYTDTGLEFGKTYNYKVKAYNVIGFGQESAVLASIAGQYPDKIVTQQIRMES